MDDNSSLSVEGRLLYSQVESRLLGIAPALITLGRYQLQRQIGEGGMGVVFEALEARSGRRVALKVLRLRGNAALQRLKREFRVLSDLHHPCLVRLRELGQDGRDAFLAMDLVEGERVREFVRPAGQLDLERLRSVLGQLAGAVSYLHAHAVVHRDLKPSNLLVDRAGRLVVLDFGLAQVLGEGAEESLSGTQRYMAPERLRGEPATEASDWYSVGRVLSELLGASDARDAKTEREVLPSDLPEEIPADLVTLCLLLLSPDPAQRPTGREIREVLGLPEPALATSPLRTIDERGLFVGREDELRRLGRTFQRAQAGSCCVVLLHGAPGIGKSALARHFLQRSAAHARVLGGRCYEGELIPYNAVDGVIDALAQLLLERTAEERARLRPMGAAELLRIFPALTAVLGDSAEAAAPIPDGELRWLREVAFRALRELLAALAAEQPLIVHVDDLHWGDADSARLWVELLSAPAPAGLLFLASFRSADAERSACVQALRASSYIDPSAQRMELALGALSESDAFALAHALAGTTLEREQLGQLSREAAGSPLFLRALVHAQLHALPVPGNVLDLASVLRNVVDELAAPARELLELIALCGRPVERELLLLAASDEPETSSQQEHLSTLRQLGLVRHVPGQRESLECFHDRLRELVAGALPPPRKREQHARLASSALLSSTPDSEFLALHCAGAGRMPDAARYAELAADRAFAGAALANAARLYGLALDYAGPVRRAELLHKAADATAAAGGCGRAVALYLEAADRSAPEAAWRLQLRAAEMLLLCGELERGWSVAAPLLRAAGLYIPRARKLQLGLAMLGMLRLNSSRAARRAGHAPPGRGRQHELRTEICFSLGHALWLNDRYLACALWVLTLPAALRTAAPGRRARALAIYAFLASMFGQVGAARSYELFDRALALAESCGDRDAKAWALIFRLICELNRAEMGDTLKQIERALCTIDDRSVESAWLRSDLATGYGSTLLMHGQFNALRVSARNLLQRSLDSGSLLHLRHAHLQQCFLQLVDDAPDAGLALLEQCQPNRERHAVEGDLFYLWMLTHLRLYTGEYALAVQEIDREWPRLMRAAFSREGLWAMALLQLRGNSWLALAAQTRNSTSLRAAEDCVAQLRRLRIRGAGEVALLIDAGVRQLGGQRARAAELYGSAARGFDALRQSGYAAAARMRQAALCEGRAAEQARQLALDWFREQNIANPAAFICMYAPVGR